MTAPPLPATRSFLRPALGLLAGLGITALIVGPGIIIATLAMLRGVDPHTFRPSPANLIVYLAINAAGAFAGGLTTSRVTAGRSFYTVFLLAFVLFMSGLVVVLRAKDPAQAEPKWYTIGQAVAVLVAALLGGFFERRQRNGEHASTREANAVATR
jgi:hypothetical protein